MTQEELLKKQKELSQKILGVVNKRCKDKEAELRSLMLELDCLNRAAHYLKEDSE